ncbi:MAG TPA: tryptophan synthase subunit alpha [Dermatophilaceae bacterium]|nr:tryptophan synthase subunit alpha [Dermatophilaceae bacterium]
MTALSAALDKTRGEGRAALVGYLPVGYPSVAGSVNAMLAMVEAGVDVVEVGVPYSDPLMDGPVIQLAAEAALARGSRLSDVFRAVRAVAATGTPAVVMSYWNPILRYGVDRFAADLAAAGGSGIITPDLVPDEAEAWLAAARRNDLDPVFLVAPSSTDERLRRTAGACGGFVYAASTMGVTGARESVGDTAQRLVARVREVTGLPVCVGLGVSTRDQAAQVAGFADGVIVGSALVRCLTSASTEEQGLRALSTLTTELAVGVRAGR